MRRREVSEAELNQILKLRERDTSWLSIQRKTGVPRRTAKHAYEEWQRRQSIEELKAARVNVATEALREHVNSLVELAKFFTAHLDVPDSPAESRSADQVINSLWENDVLRELGPDQSYYHLSESERRRISLQNRLLFESLQVHTYEKVRWDTLANWKHSWDACVSLFSHLRREAQDVMKNFIDQESGLLHAIQRGNRKNSDVTDLTDEVLVVLWKRILDDTVNPESAVAQVISGHDGTTDFKSVKIGHKVVFSSKDKTLSEKVASVCNGTYRNLCSGKEADIVNPLKNHVRTMRTAFDELIGMLNPPILRPLVIRTRCNLCPA